MKAPDKIHIHIGGLGLMVATQIPVNAPGEEEYIRKDALLEWAKEWKERYPYSHEFQMIIDKIESL